MTYPGKKFVISIHYSGGDSTFYANGILMADFSDKYYANTLFHVGFNLGQITKDFASSSIEELAMGLNGSVYDFSIDHRVTRVDDIKNIHAYLMNKHNVDNKFPTDTKKLFH